MASPGGLRDRPGAANNSLELRGWTMGMGAGSRGGCGIARRVLAGLAVWLAAVAMVVAAPGAVAPTEAPRSEPTYLMRILLDRPAEQLRRLRGLGLDVASFDIKTGVASVLGGPSELSQVRGTGLALFEVLDKTPTPESVMALSDYLSPDEIDAKLDQYAATYPAIAVKGSYPDPTVEGRTVSWIKISDNAAVDEDEPRIAFVGQHHAREVMTPEVTMDIVDYLLTRYGSDPEVTDWVDRFQIWVVPTQNPDGANRVFTGSINWRKNCRDNGDGSFGVDLNRNYPFIWGPEGCGGSSSTPSAEDYRGPSAASEPETRGFVSVVEQAHPSITLSYHTSGEYVIHPFGCSSQKPDSPDLRTFRDTGSDLSVSMVNDTGNGYYRMGTAYELLYDVDGDSDGWAYGDGGALAVTIELNNDAQGFQPDYATWRNSTVQRARGGWKFLLRRLDGPALDGHVRDACTGAPLAAAHRIVEQVFTHGEAPRAAEPAHGRYHRIVDPGSYTVEFSAAGHRSQTWPMAVEYEPETRDVDLVPEGSWGVAYRSSSVDDSSGDADGQIDPGETVRLSPIALATGEALTGLVAQLSSSDPYVTITDPGAAFPSLGAGMESAASDPFAFTVSPAAPDGYEASLTVTWSADQTLCHPVDTLRVRVTRGVPSCPEVEENLDADPGWTIENSGPNGWAFGAPHGGGGTSGPSAAHTGPYVYGTNLSGNYGNSATYVLTTTPFDLRGLRNTELHFWRWLNNEPGDDVAKVEISSDGATWHEVWKGFGRDTRWEEYRYDVSSIADQEDAVRVRFTLTSDSTTTASGLYIDDLSFCGESLPSAAGKLKYQSHSIDDSDTNVGDSDGVVDVGEIVTMPVTLLSTLDRAASAVTAILRTDDPGVVIHDAVAYYPDIAAGGSAVSATPHFTWSATPDCRGTVRFELEARWNSGLTAKSYFTVHVGTLQSSTVLSDDFETDKGWTTEAGPDVKRGFWVREDPYGVTDAAGAPVQPEDDHTTAPGVACWVTGNPRPRPKFEPTDGDVDGGNVDLFSPVFDGDRAVTLDFEAARWFHRSQAAFQDASTFSIDVTNDGGGSWYNLETLTSNASVWQVVHYDLAQRVTPSAEMGLRFRVNESAGGIIPGDTLLEGLVDDVTITRARYEWSTFTPPALLRPNPVGSTLRGRREGIDVRLSWTAPPSDGGHGPATSYRVYRSTSPDGTFTEIGRPTGELFVDVGAARPGEPDYYYRVAAENSGGSE